VTDPSQLKDLWSNSAQDRAEFQTADDVRTTGGAFGIEGGVDACRCGVHTPGQIIAGLGEAGLLMYRADCWTYTMNDVKEGQRALIEQRGAAERLGLRQTADGRWTVDLYWVRVLARTM
jgi:hypothetical protein